MNKLVFPIAFAAIILAMFGLAPTEEERRAIEARETAERQALLPSPDCVVKDLGSQFGVDHVVAVWCPSASVTTTSTENHRMVGKVNYTDTTTAIQINEEPKP